MMGIPVVWGHGSHPSAAPEKPTRSFSRYSICRRLKASQWRKPFGGHGSPCPAKHLGMNVPRRSKRMWRGTKGSGLQVVSIDTARGPVVLASDAFHLYANLLDGLPFPIVHDIGQMMEGWRELLALTGDLAHLVPGHDPLVRELYPSPSENWPASSAPSTRNPVSTRYSRPPRAAAAELSPTPVLRKGGLQNARKPADAGFLKSAGWWS